VNHRPDNDSERVVDFQIGRVPVFGVLHTPSGSANWLSKPGIVFVASGFRSRRGPSLLYVRFARRLCRAGYAVLRYDPPGIGDSSGELEGMAEYKRKLVDRCESTMSAIGFLQTETGLSSIGLAGLCAGSYSAVIAGAADPRVDLLILGSLPVQQLGDSSEEAATNVIAQDCLRKALQWRSWQRLLTGKSQFTWLGRVARQLLTGRFRSPELDDALWSAMARFLGAGNRALFIYGSRDGLYPPFSRSYTRLLKTVDPTGAYHDVRVIENANHTYSQVVWQDELMKAAIAWMGEREGRKKSMRETG
jgi:pimeloyl-ACP methyl ester carboxylesterase